MMAMMAVGAPTTLVHLSGVDLLIIAIYFLLVLGIGFYLKKFAKTGEDFFLAGREMTAWVAGLAFVSANLGSLELLGWAGNAYQYGIMAAHWYSSAAEQGNTPITSDHRAGFRLPVIAITGPSSRS